MIIDCDRCELQAVACDDCVVTALLEHEAEPISGDTAEALRVLGNAGLTPPLRLRVSHAG